MTRAKMIMVTVCLTAIGWTASSASADETITMFQWTGGGSPATAWQSDGSWDLPDWPDDALDGATISVGSDLSVNIGSTPVTVAELVLDGTSAGTDIDITADTGGKLLLNNGDDNTYYSAAGGGVDLVPSLNEEGVNHGRVYITSNGVSGSTNTISAPIGLRNNGFLEGVDFFGNTSITLAGDIDIAGYVPPEGTEPEVDEAGMLRSYLPEGTKLLITGNISLDDSVDPSYPRTMSLNNYYTTDHADAPAGTIEISGNISGAGALVIGNTWEYHTEQELYDRAPRVSLPLSTVILSGDNSEFTGDVVLARANTVIRSDTALGSDGTLSMGGEKADKMEVGVRLVADGGDRTISGKNMAITRWLTVMGDNSLTWNGIVYQNNSYGFINLIPHDLQADTGPTLTLAGPVYAARRMEGPPLPGRILTFDGTGKTVITGGIHNWYDDWNGTDPLPDADHSGNVGLLRKRGTGSLVIAYDGEGDSYTDYGGHTFVQGGNLHFATADDLPNPIDCYGLFGQFLSSGGAVGVDDGVLDNTDFLGHLNNSSDPVQNTTTGTFYEYTKGNVIFAIYDDGGLMLGTDEYGTPEEPQSLNFNSGDLANAANMSLAAHETGSTFYGTITPSTTVKVNPNTYMLGGGSGTLIMPTADQLTGSNNLLVANGGEVQLVETNNYTGKTRVVGKYATSLSDDAAFGTADRDLDGDIVGGTGGGDQPGRYRDELQQKPVGTTLTVSHLADGGQDSSIGRSASTATNLVIQGSTLKYVGGAASTDRLFTVGTSGATIDASGSGAVNQHRRLGHRHRRGPHRRHGAVGKRQQQ
jgi:hypothetical protein